MSSANQHLSFSIIHTHHVQFSSNKFQSCYEKLARETPPMGHLNKVTFKVKLVISKTCLFPHLKGTLIHVFLHNIGRIYWSNHVLFKGVHFVFLSYSTQGWHSYVAGNLFKIKKRETLSMPIARSII